MLTVQQHLELAEANENFAETIAGLSPRFPGWEITALFYSALHYVSAFLASQGHYPQIHHRRNALIARLTNVGSEYQDLLSRSVDARYNNISFTSEDVDQIRVGDFRRVKEEVLALLPR